MSNVNFFTPISFGDQVKSTTQSFLEKTDDYFYLGGKKAYVVDGNQTVLIQDTTPFLLTALKVISYLTVIIPLLMLSLKAILRSTQNFHLIDVKQKLEEGINISEETRAKIQELMPKIRRGAADDQIKWIAKGNNLIFTLISEANLIFKMAPPGRGLIRNGKTLSAQQLIEQRFTNMIKAKEVTLTHHLDQLVVPHAQKFEVEGMTLIAEETVKIVNNESHQEQLYSELPGLNKTVKQLTTFIAKTGFNDVEWRNIPIIENEFGSDHIALIDVEELESAEDGIFGRYNRRGLINCLSSEEQIDIALAEASRLGIVKSHISPAEAKAERLTQIKEEQQLQQFYAQNGILNNPLKPVQIEDLDTLGLDLNEEGILTIERKKTGSDNEWAYVNEPITLRQVATELIHEVNKEINKAPEGSSTKGQRKILLDANAGGVIYKYGRLGLPNPVWMKEADRGKRWPQRIINALIDKGHLFKLINENGHGYYLQA